MIHFKSTRPNTLYKCDFVTVCFRHQMDCSNMKDHMSTWNTTCAMKFQFPYQLNNYLTTHKGLGRHQSTLYKRTFGSKCFQVSYKHTHNIQLKYELCLIKSTKTCNSEITLNQHKRGMHDPGWNAPCGKNYNRITLQSRLIFISDWGNIITKEDLCSPWSFGIWNWFFTGSTMDFIPQLKLGFELLFLQWVEPCINNGLYIV